MHALGYLQNQSRSTPTHSQAAAAVCLLRAAKNPQASRELKSLKLANSAVESLALACLGLLGADHSDAHWAACPAETARGS